ncbi:hypothetical protein F2P47_17015 [Parvibaculum sedimenti]|uniref:Uncharacterized protein n=1 Tax=Parvibaculum sedimenti TaxID=2608632 RepID=A0A6N6VJ21_9HYPH|nr:DUF6489 family protein [Parvibaculum sedimenti]KAB7738503.1 hypothetical protein F2P47_17015 [Parvibaculum sedimenti]
MKVTIDVDLSPEEARRLMGLPDLEPMQQRLLAQLEKQMAQNMSYMDPETLVKTIMPVGAQGLEQFQNLLWSMARTATGNGKKTNTRKPE